MNLLDSLRRLHPDLSDLDDSRFAASVYDRDPRLAKSGITPGEYFGMLGLQEAGSARQARQPLGIDRGGPAPEDVSAVGEFGAGFGRGVLGVLKTPFSLAEFAGDVTGSESLERLGRWGTEPIEQYIEESPRLQKAPSISGDIRKNPQLWTDPAWYLSLVGEGLPTIFSMLLPGAALGKGAQALGLGVKGVGAARAIGVAGASMGLEAGAAAETAKGYEERTGEQIPAGRKVAAVLGTGVLAGSLESIPILNFFGKSVGRTLIRKVLSSMALEGGTEGAQELVANAFAKYGYDPTQDMVEGVIESVVAGAIIGAPFGAAKTMQERLEEAAGPKNFNEVVKNIEASEKEIVAHEPAGRIIEPGKEIKVGVPAPTNMIGGEPVAEAAQGVAKEPLYVDEKYGKVLAHEKGMVKVGIQTDMMTGKASTQGDIAQTMAPKKKVVTPGIDLGEAEREIARNKFLDRPREYPSVGPELPVTEVGEQAGHVLAKDVKMAPEPFMAPQFEPVDTFLEGVGEPGTTAGEILGKESPVPATGETPSLSQEEPGPGIPPAQAPAPGEGVGVSPPAPAPPSGAPKEELPKFSRTPKGALSYSQKKPKGGAPEAQRVFDYLKPTLASWRNAPSVKVVQSEKELPVAIYAEAKKRETEGATPGIKGAFYAGQVHIVADNITNMRDAERTLAHEALRHYGFRLFLGEKYKAEMQRASKNKTVADLAKAKAAQYKLNISKSADAYAAIEEALAEMGDKGVKSSAWDRIVNLFKKWLRKVFPHQAEGMTDREVRQLISDSSWAVRKGKRQTQTYITKGTAFMPLGEDVGKEPAFMRKALDSFPDISIVRETGPVHDKGIWN